MAGERGKTVSLVSETLKVFPASMQVDVAATPGSPAGETVAMLELRRPLEEMGGRYICRATNFVGVDESAVRIVVNGQW